MSRTVHCAFFLLTGYGTEKLLKRLAGRKEVDDAVLRLDALTKEEHIIITARNLEVTYHVDGNVEATKVLTKDIRDSVKVTKALTEDISDDVKATKDGTATLPFRPHARTDPKLRSQNSNRRS